MGLNTTLLIFKNIASDKIEEKTYEIFKLLNLEIVNSVFNVESSQKSSLLYFTSSRFSTRWRQGSDHFRECRILSWRSNTHQSLKRLPDSLHQFG